MDTLLQRFLIAVESASGFLDELQERFLGDQEAKHVCDDALVGRVDPPAACEPAGTECEIDPASGISGRDRRSLLGIGVGRRPHRPPKTGSAGVGLDDERDKVAQCEC